MNFLLAKMRRKLFHGIKETDGLEGLIETSDYDFYELNTSLSGEGPRILTSKADAREGNIAFDITLGPKTEMAMLGKLPRMVLKEKNAWEQCEAVVREWKAVPWTWRRYVQIEMRP